MCPNRPTEIQGAEVSLSFRVANALFERVILVRDNPRYPMALINAEIQGAVAMHVTLDEAGNVLMVEPVAAWGAPAL
jgi:hypothetical protein